MQEVVCFGPVKKRPGSMCITDNFIQWLSNAVDICLSNEKKEQQASQERNSSLGSDVTTSEKTKSGRYKEEVEVTRNLVTDPQNEWKNNPDNSSELDRTQIHRGSTFVRSSNPSGSTLDSFVDQTDGPVDQSQINSSNLPPNHDRCVRFNSQKNLTESTVNKYPELDRVHSSKHRGSSTSLEKSVDTRSIRFDDSQDLQDRSQDGYPRVQRSGSVLDTIKDIFSSSGSPPATVDVSAKSTLDVSAKPKPPLKSYPSMFSFFTNYPQSVKTFEGLNEDDLQPEPGMDRRGTLALISDFLFRRDSDIESPTGDSKICDQLGPIAEDDDEDLPWKENCCDYAHDRYGNKHTHSVREDYDEHVEHYKLDGHERGSEATQSAGYRSYPPNPAQISSTHYQGTTQEKPSTQSKQSKCLQT